MTEDEKDDIEKEEAVRETVEIPDNGALRLSREDASKTLERALEKHGALGTKAIRMAQINGVVISILIAVASQLPEEAKLNVFLYLGPGLFLVSTILAVLGFRGQNLPIGIGPKEVESILSNNLSEDQYLVWYLTKFYSPAITNVANNSNCRAKYIRYSVYFFLIGTLVISFGIVIRLAPPISNYV